MKIRCVSGGMLRMKACAFLMRGQKSTCMGLVGGVESCVAGTVGEGAAGAFFVCQLKWSIVSPNSLCFNISNT